MPIGPQKKSKATGTSRPNWPNGKAHETLLVNSTKFKVPE